MARGEAINERMSLLAQEKSKRQHLASLRRDTTRKIDFVSRKAVIEHREAYHLIRDFFKEFLEKRYEFTTNELRAEIKKVYISNTVRARISALLDLLEAIEYANVHYSRDDLLKILAEFDQIVTQLVHIHTTKKSWWTRVRAFMLREDDDDQSVITDLPAIEEEDAYKVRIHTLVERCYIALERHRMQQAKIAYKHLLEEYNLLDDERKRQYYLLVEQTYTDIINRSKMQ